MQKGWWCPNRALASTFGCPFQMNQPSFSVWPLADGLFRQADPFDCAPRRLYGLMWRILGGWRPSALRGILPTQSLRQRVTLFVGVVSGLACRLELSKSGQTNRF